MATKKLTPIQRALLESAARRSDGSLLPTPEALDVSDAAIAKAVASLVRRSLVEEGDEHHGPTITAAGRLAVGIEAPVSETGVGTDVPVAAIAPAPVSATSKIAMVTAMLGRESGATLAELVEATGWLPHTTRAALTGLRKKGHAIVKAKRDDVTCYTLEAVA